MSNHDFDIPKSLRRDSKESRHWHQVKIPTPFQETLGMILSAVFMVIFVGLLVVLAVALETPEDAKADGLAYAPKIQVNGKLQTASDFCIMARADHKTIGEKMTGDLAALCGK